VGVSRTNLRLAVVVACGVAGCGDPDQYLRHAKDDAGTLPITTGDPNTGGAGTGDVSTTGRAGTTGAAGTFAGSGAAGTTGAAGTIGAAGTTGAAGNGSGTGAAGTIAGSGSAGTTGAAGANGAGGAGGAAGAAGANAGTAGSGGAGTCPGCKINVTYTCLTSASDSRSFVVEAKNAGAMLVLLKDLKLRYWYTVDAGKEQELDCDTAHLTCPYIITNQSPPPAQPVYAAVTPPRTKANEYVEIAITQGAIDVGGTTGSIQLRLHNKDYSPVNQANDYSADCGSIGQAHDSGKITAYVGGVLVGGTEPQ
jgi:hypothetical protein